MTLFCESLELFAVTELLLIQYISSIDLLVQSKSFDGSAFRETHLSELLKGCFIHPILFIFI